MHPDHDSGWTTIPFCNTIAIGNEHVPTTG
jgi:hypothetical protein